LKLVYDVARESVYGGMWFLFAWGLFAALIVATAYSNARGALEFGKKVQNYIAGFIGIFFFVLAAAWVVVGLAERSACIEEAQAGAFDTALGKVSNVKRGGRSLPFHYTFNLGVQEFKFHSSLANACGFAPPPQTRFNLRTGQTLRIDYSGEKIYRITIIAQSPEGGAASSGS